jgi:hypothetical protein
MSAADNTRYVNSGDLNAELVRPVDLAKKLAEVLIEALADDATYFEVEFPVRPFDGHAVAIVRVRIGA